MANGLPDLMFAQPVTAMQQGQAAGNALAVQRNQLVQMAAQQKTQNALANSLPLALTGNAGDAMAAQQGVAATGDPRALAQVQSVIQGFDEQRKAKLAATNEAVARVLLPIGKLPPEQQQAIYAQQKANLASQGYDVSGLPDDAATGLPFAAQHVMTMDQFLQQSGYGSPEKGVAVAPGTRIVDPRTGRLIADNPANLSYQAVPFGSGVAAGAFDPRSGMVRPATAQQPSAPDNSAQQRWIMQSASDLVNGGHMSPEQADQWVQSQFSKLPGTAVGGSAASSDTPSFGIGLPKASQTPDSFRAASPDELTAAGLPAGSSAQINTKTGKMDILSKPAALSADKQADVAAKRQKAMEAQQEAVNSTQDSIDRIDALMRSAGFNDLGTISGDIAQKTPFIRSDAKNAQAQLETIKSQSLLNTLSSLKSLSPTGASGFGALSDSEGKILGNAAANLDTGGQDNASLRANILDLRRKLERTRDRIKGTAVQLPEEMEQSPAPASPTPSAGGWSVKRID